MDRQGKITKDFDVHDYDTQISYTMKNLKKDVSKRNYETILDYDRNMKLSNLSKATRNKHLQAMLGITRKLPKDKDWKDVLRTDIDDLVIWIMETYADHKGQESHSSYDMKKVLRLFYRWFKTGDRKKKPHQSEVYEIQGITFSKVKEKIVREELVDEDDLKKLLAHCQNLQDKALIHVHYEAGTRPGEILSLKMKNVKFDEYGAIISVAGKTVSRPIRLIESVPNLLTWYNTHPFKEDPDHPFWITLEKGRYGEPMTYAGCHRKLQRIIKRARINKKINLNLFRHSEATRTASFMTEATLRKRHGWTANSKMTSKYVHMVQSDVEDAILTHHGLSKRKEIPKDTPVKCQFCDMFNTPDSALCSKCAKPLNLQEAIKQDESKQNQLDFIVSELSKLSKDLEDMKRFQPMFDDRMKSFEKFLNDYPDMNKLYANYEAKQK